MFNQEVVTADDPWLRPVAHNLFANDRKPLSVMGPAITGYLLTQDGGQNTLVLVVKNWLQHHA